MLAEYLRNAMRELHALRQLTGLGSAWETYQPYIDGEKEISEINEEIWTGFVR